MMIGTSATASRNGKLSEAISPENYNLEVLSMLVNSYEAGI